MGEKHTPLREVQSDKLCFLWKPTQHLFLPDSTFSFPVTLFYGATPAPCGEPGFNFEVERRCIDEWLLSSFDSQRSSDLWCLQFLSRAALSHFFRFRFSSVPHKKTKNNIYIYIYIYMAQYSRGVKSRCSRTSSRQGTKL